jgi:hypothetical protein
MRFQIGVRAAIAIAVLLASASAGAEQVVDSRFHPVVERPAFKPERGPVVMVDEAHFNMHTASGQYAPFAELLRQDGYRVAPFKTKFTSKAPKAGRVLVIANAATASIEANWDAPPESAFTDDEIASVRDWVKQGGALFLIVDHLPFPGATDKLAASFGVKWSNGIAQDPRTGGLITFRRTDSALADHAITRGRNESERIDSVMTFGGSVFQASDAEPLLTFTGDAVSWLPKSAYKLEAGSPSINVKGWQQGAVLHYGKGRIAFFGEAAMFTAQRVGTREDPMGMNNPRARQNQQFLLNVVHWLSGVLK